MQKKYDWVALRNQYFLEHQNPINRWMHSVSLVAAWIFFFLMIFQFKWIYLFLMLLSYSGAMIGHIIFEKNVPTFTAYIKKHGWGVGGLLFMFIVEEICVFYIMFQDLGIVRKRRARDSKKIHSKLN